MCGWVVDKGIIGIERRRKVEYRGRRSPNSGCVGHVREELISWGKRNAR